MEYTTEQPGDPKLIEEANKQKAKADLKRARITAVVFGVTAGLTLIFLVFGFVQKGIADENIQIALEQTKRAESLQLQLTNCVREAMRQQKLAEEAAAHANEAQRQAEEQLRKYLKK